MKKANDILKVPVIAIAEGEELGVVEDLLIDAETGRVEYLVINDEEWYLGAKLISFADVKGIGIDVITTDKKSNLKTFADYEIAYQLAKKAIKIIGTKVYTEMGLFMGIIDEIIIDDADGYIYGCELLGDMGDAKDRSVSILPSQSVLTYGKHVSIVVDHVEETLLKEFNEEELAKKKTRLTGKNSFDISDTTRKVRLVETGNSKSLADGVLKDNANRPGEKVNPSAVSSPVEKKQEQKSEKSQVTKRTLLEEEMDALPDHLEGENFQSEDSKQQDTKNENAENKQKFQGAKYEDLNAQASLQKEEDVLFRKKTLEHNKVVGQTLLQKMEVATQNNHKFELQNPNAQESEKEVRANHLEKDLLHFNGEDMKDVYGELIDAGNAEEDLNEDTNEELNAETNQDTKADLNAETNQDTNDDDYAETNEDTNDDDYEDPSEDTHEDSYLDSNEDVNEEGRVGILEDDYEDENAAFTPLGQVKNRAYLSDEKSTSSEQERNQDEDFWDDQPLAFDEPKPLGETAKAPRKEEEKKELFSDSEFDLEKELEQGLQKEFGNFQMPYSGKLDSEQSEQENATTQFSPVSTQRNTDDAGNLFRKKQKEFLIGRIATRKVVMDDGVVLVEKGQLITDEIVGKIKTSEKLTELTMNSR